MDNPVIKLVLIALWGLLWIIPVWFARLCRKIDLRDRMVALCSAGLLRIVGIRLRVTGELTRTRPLLVVCNHLTYFDIPILASHVPLRFTPKSEIAKWPFIGFICRITDCVFVERKPGRVKDTAKQLHEVLQRGEVLSIFPEATTGNGIHLLPFKTGFFSLAEETFNDQPLTIQPVAMTYTRVRNLPIDSQTWYKIAWVGDTELVSHLWDFLKLGPMDVEMHFLEPVTIQAFEGRKALAAHCQQAIASTIDQIKASQQVAKLPKESPVWSLFKSRSKS